MRRNRQWAGDLYQRLLLHMSIKLILHIWYDPSWLRCRYKKSIVNEVLQQQHFRRITNPVYPWKGCFREEAPIDRNHKPWTPNGTRGGLFNTVCQLKASWAKNKGHEEALRLLQNSRHQDSRMNSCILDIHENLMYKMLRWIATPTLRISPALSADSNQTRRAIACEHIEEQETPHL